MKPEDYAKAGTEFSHQTALFMWVAMVKQQYPELDLMFAIKNEEKSGSKIVGGRFKASGVKKGVADIFLPIPRYDKNKDLCCGLFLEMKKPGGKPSKEQLEFRDKVQEQGYGWVCCDSWDKAKDILIEYLTL